MAQKRSKQFKKEFADLLAKNKGNISKTCEKLDVSRRAFYDWLKEPWFAELVEVNKEAMVDKVEDALIKAALSGNVTAQSFYLKAHGKSRGYIEKQEISGDFHVGFSDELKEKIAKKTG